MPLLSDWPTWWAKLEVFRIKGPVLYFDLDTIVVGSIDPLVEAVARLEADDFLMLRAFRDGNWASGIMGWTGDYDWLRMLFTSLSPSFPCVKSFIRARVGSQIYWGDQEWIREQLKKRATNVIAAQNVCPGIYSYRRHCLEALPSNARIVCFHGQPRPADVQPCPS